MTLKLQTEVNWIYPVMAFRATGEVEYFSDLEDFSAVPRWVIDEEVFSGMELIDANGEQWFVKTVAPRPPKRQLRWWHFVDRLFGVLVTVDLGLEKGGNVPFAVVRQRVSDQEALEIRKDAMSPEEAEQQVEETLDALRKANSYEDISEVLSLSDRVGFLD